MGIDFPWMLIVGLCVATATLIIAILRRTQWPWIAWIAPGLLLLALAGGGIHWQRPGAGSVAVMIDLSPSTRGAAYRDPARLRHRLHQLLPQGQKQLIFFSDHSEFIRHLPDHALDDMPCEKTRYTPPPDAAAVVLFSDGRFDPPPMAAPTYVVVDPSLEQAGNHDSAVTDLEMENNRAMATIRGKAALDEAWHRTALHDNVFVRQDVGQSRIVARLAGRDLWPENDALSMTPAQPWASQRWWIGVDAPAGWKPMTPDQLPVEPAAWLAPSIILLNDLPASALSVIQQNRLEQYVRDLGGSLVLAGARHAPATDDYGQTALERLSPLTGDPPRPEHRWIFLIDASGSMNEGSRASSRWRWAGDALRSALKTAPVRDRADIGGFAADIHWWARDIEVDAARQRPWPPADVTPHGPTNLETALRELTEVPVHSRTLATNLLILTDAEATLTDASALSDKMLQRRIKLWVLVTGHGKALAALSRIADQTGGVVRVDPQMNTWSRTMRGLTRSARGRVIHETPSWIHFTGLLRSLNSREVSPWRQAWIKQGATSLTDESVSDNPSAKIAHWRFGAGQVIAAGFAFTPTEADAIAARMAVRPIDPRLSVTWRTGRSLSVRISAEDSGQWLNGLKFRLTVRPADPSAAPVQEMEIPQTAPGLYQLTLPAPRRDSIVTVMDQQRPVDRKAVAGRYAPEFDEIGIDRSAIHHLASASGGQVIDVRHDRPIDFKWEWREISLSPWLAILAALFIAAGLVWWKHL